MLLLMSITIFIYIRLIGYTKSDNIRKITRNIIRNELYRTIRTVSDYKRKTGISQVPYWQTRTEGLRSERLL